VAPRQVVQPLRRLASRQIPPALVVQRRRRRDRSHFTDTGTPYTERSSLPAAPAVVEAVLCRLPGQQSRDKPIALEPHPTGRMALPSPAAVEPRLEVEDCRPEAVVDLALCRPLVDADLFRSILVQAGLVLA
jgi:hypothetical protein